MAPRKRLGHVLCYKHLLLVRNLSHFERLSACVENCQLMDILQWALEPTFKGMAHCKAIGKPPPSIRLRHSVWTSLNNCSLPSMLTTFDGRVIFWRSTCWFKHSLPFRRGQDLLKLSLKQASLSPKNFCNFFIFKCNYHPCRTGLTCVLQTWILELRILKGTLQHFSLTIWNAFGGEVLCLTNLLPRKFSKSVQYQRSYTKWKLHLPHYVPFLPCSILHYRDEGGLRGT